MNNIDISERILYEDNHLIAVNKCCGEIVQGDKSGDKPLVETVKSYLKAYYNKQGNVFCGVIHRIDRPVSGVVLFAKTSKALARMNRLIQERKIEKTYWALTETKPLRREDYCVDYMWKNEALNKSFVSPIEKKGWQKAELSYRLLGSGDRYHKIEIALHTGRHHQIRAQLAARGAIIKGDLKYGAKRSNPDASISLHAHEISFEHPVNQSIIKIKAPILHPLMKKIWESIE